MAEPGRLRSHRDTAVFTGQTLVVDGGSATL
jgi:hypothetical protein